MASGKRLKIAIIASWYPTTEDPVNGIFVQDQAHALAEVCDVAVLAPRWVQWRDLPRGRWHPERSVEQEGKVTVFRQRWVAPFPRCPASWLHASSLHAIQRSFESLLVQWGRPDILHPHVVLPGGYAAVKLGQKYHIPVVLTEHSGPFHEIQLKSAGERRLCRYTFHHSDCIIGISPEMKRQINQFDPSIPVTIVGNLVRTRYFLPADSAKSAGDRSRVRFLLQAILCERKGGSYLIEAARILVDRGYSNFTVIIGGDGESRSRWERLVKSQALSDYVQFLGRLSSAEVREQMQKCDVFVLPSLHENFGIVSGEAMACGKPVIATRCGGSEFVVTPETGVLVEPADAVGLANAMEGFITGAYRFDPAAIRASVVDRFGEEAFLSNLARVYEEVLQQK